MPNKLTSTQISPENDPLSNTIRWAKIHIGGKVLHSLTTGGKSMSETCKGFLEVSQIQVEIDEDSEKQIQDFINNEKSGVIILNHPNGNFSDYIPLLSKLPQETLEKISFFPGKHTVPMFQREFGDEYDFIPATFDSFEEAKKGLASLETSIEKVKNQNGFIFIIPGGTESGDSEIHKKFASLFERMVKKLNDNTPLLAGNVEYEAPVSYSEVYIRAFKTRLSGILWKNKALIARLQARKTNLGIFKNKTGGDMRNTYEELFKT